MAELTRAQVGLCGVLKQPLDEWVRRVEDSAGGKRRRYADELA